MSTTIALSEIDYPESDGKPMGETDLHRNWMIRLLEILQHRYDGEQVYVTGDLLVYYEEGQPFRFIVPDCFVVLDCAPGQRRTFKTWEEKRVPDVVFEITSRGTSSVDIIEKPAIYERIGVREYFLYDPTAEYLTPALQGYRMVDGSLREIPKEAGRMHCETLGIDLALNERALVIVDSETGLEQLTPAEANERRARDAALSAERALKAAELAHELALQAKTSTEQEREAKQREHAARQEAESRVQELEDELRRLKGDDA